MIQKMSPIDGNSFQKDLNLQSSRELVKDVGKRSEEEEK
jgi:hypothetical protein